MRDQDKTIAVCVPVYTSIDSMESGVQLCVDNFAL